MNKKYAHKSGYTLLELIVSMSIITLLTGLFLANYHSSNRRTDVIMTAQTMVSDFRYAQANALGLIKYDGEVPAGGWGIFVTSDPQEYRKYIIFADENDDELYQDTESMTVLGGRTIELSPNINIESITVNGVAKAKAVITFLPPDPITRIKTDTGTGTVVEIKLKENVNNSTKTVRVNFLGLIEVID
ncbi:hypothetical protein CVU83_03410 [Candidatus Falkowbacteria bacterium HGW-Falkowbacteria-2]|uniref:General secretion pathway GspH domain-containing protein n=1 Tax=Candidatus Falkowbacteria bacterium HGW-Falkowbacteria-2 TaxID=2013769 RepID=A0A2N2DXD4_9BACT|nr:MAG: hypothetical protein CVU83_03410 [Candidatus Falkowbacteria bacterium HGW-Falkowbacteria-2]